MAGRLTNLRRGSSKYWMNAKRSLWVALLAPMAWTTAMAEQRHEDFDKDPGWDGHNNRSVGPEVIRQDFGWSAGTTHAGGSAGEIGGLIHPPPSRLLRQKFRHSHWMMS